MPTLKHPAAPGGRTPSGGVMPSSDRYRSTFNALINELKNKVKSAKAKGNKEALEKLANVIITYGFLRFEQSLNGTINQVTFNVLTNQPGTTVTELRLQITDEFVVLDQAFYLTKVGTTTAPTDAERMVGRCHTFPNPAIFTGSGEAANLQCIYNSSLAVTIASKVWVQQAPLYDYFRADMAQQGLLLFTASNYGTLLGLKPAMHIYR